jgi:hypothetical protein
MDELNKAFMKSPASFLRVHPLDLERGGFLTAAVGGQNGIHEFDLVHEAEKNGKVVLRPYPERSQRPLEKLAIMAKIKEKHHPIRAYFLPWETKRMKFYELGTGENDPKFFFTSKVDGCRIQVAGNRVAHIAGDAGGGDGKYVQGEGDEGRIWRIQQAQSAFKGEYRTSRRLSRTVEYPMDTEDGYSYAMFVGHRSHDVWHFFIQGVKRDKGTGKFVAQELSMTQGGEYGFHDENMLAGAPTAPPLVPPMSAASAAAAAASPADAARPRGSK